MTHLRSALTLAPFLPVIAGLAVSGCTEGDTSYVPVGSSVAAATSGAAPAAPTPVGPLHQKALDFEDSMRTLHTPHGQVQDVRIDASGQVLSRGGPSRCIWTAAYASAQCMRYRVTGDPVALQNMERSLWALHGMHAITGQPGIICRGYDDPHLEPNGYPGHGAFSQYNYFPQRTSRDQYAGWFQGVGFCFDEIQDPVLKATLTQDIRDIADLLMAGDLELIGDWGGTRQQFFDLSPDYAYLDRINAHTWATVDDFPFNLITQAVPYDPQIAQALRTAQFPAIRSGEALKAALVFTVAEHATGDPRYTRYKDELLHNRDFAGIIERNITLVDDMLAGRNLHLAHQILVDVFAALAQVVGTYMQLSGQSAFVQHVSLLVVQSVGNWLADALVRLIDYLTDPNNVTKRSAFFDDLRTFASVMVMLNQQSLAQKITDFLAGPAALLDRDGLKHLANSLRSYLGINLDIMPLTTLIELETDPGLQSIYRGAIDAQWFYLQNDHDPATNLLHAAYVAPGPNDVAHSLDALTRFPVDMRARRVDNSNWPGLVVSPWPDRLGRHGNLAMHPSHFPIDARAPDIFPWRRNPRDIVTGRDDPQRHIAPLGYLYPYWVGRYHGLIRADQ